MSQIVPTLPARYAILPRPSEGRASLVPAVDTTSGGSVLLLNVRCLGQEEQQRAMRQGRVLVRLRHPNLPRVLDVFEDGSGICVVLEPFHGQDFDRVVAEAGPIPVEDLRDGLRDIVSALEFLHSQEPPVILEDLAPGAITLTTTGRLLISGCCFRVRATPEERPFASPEALRGEGPHPAHELYSLGAVVAFLVTGRPPLAPGIPPDLAGVPSDLAVLVQELLSLDPSRRPALAAIRRIRDSMVACAVSPVSLPGTPPRQEDTLWSLLFGQGGTDRPAAAPEEDGVGVRQALERAIQIDLAEAEVDRELARVLPDTVARAVQGIVVARPREDDLLLAVKGPPMSTSTTTCGWLPRGEPGPCSTEPILSSSTRLSTSSTSRTLSRSPCRGAGGRSAVVSIVTPWWWPAPPPIPPGGRRKSRAWSSPPWIAC